MKKLIKNITWMTLFNLVIKLAVIALVVSVVLIAYRDIKADNDRVAKHNARRQENIDWWKDKDPKEVISNQVNEELIPALVGGAEDIVSAAYNPDPEVVDIINQIDSELGD